MKSAIKPNSLLRLAMLSTLLFFLNTIAAKNYYVRTDGNNSNNGLSNTPTGAWKSVNDALYGYCNWGAGPTGQGVPMLPGDTLFVNDGVYIEDGYGYGLKIEGIAGSNTNRFVLKSINKWGAKLQLSSQYNSFNIYNSKGVTVDGFDIFNVAGSTNIHSGINIGYPSEFVTIRNCKVHNFGLAGISGDGSNIIIENNEVYDNSIRNAGNGSGINFYHPKVVSANRLTGGFGHIIRGNRVYNNYCTQSYISVTGVPLPPTDGNGIIIDDWNFTQDASGTPYKVPCLIENNVCFKNGGSGIRVYDSDNVTVRNNTCYYNSWVTSTYPSGSNDYPSGDIGVTCEAGKGNNIVVVNNICISDPSLPVSNYGIGVGDKITNASVRNNYTNKLFFTAGGTANIIGSNAQFVLAGVNPATADFHLTATSPAINIGLNTNAAATDYDGIVRPQGGTVDAGAYERAGGCTPPSAGTITSAASICLGSTTTATSNVAGGVWSIAPLSIATINATSGVITSVSAGTATISYTVSANGCSSIVTKALTINALPSAGTITSAASLCLGSTTTATSNVAGGTWSITPLSIATINATSGVITSVSAGTATISYTVSANGCSSTVTKALTINALPSTGTITSAASLCLGSTTTATSNVAGGTWSITPLSIATINATSGVITSVSAGTATISYTVSVNGCSSTVTKALTINALPSAGAITSAASLCLGSSTTATSDVAGGTWSIAPLSIATINATTGVITSVSAGTATISYTVSANGCSSTVTKALTINALPSAGTITSAASLCLGSTTTATADVAGGVWSIAPLSIATINATTGVITSVSAGTATISYTVSANGCSSTVTKVLTINAAVAAPTFSLASSILTAAQNVTLSTTTSGASIRYTIDNTTPTATVGTVYSTQIAVSTTQTIKAIASNGGCSSSVSSATYTFNTPIVVRARSANSAGASMRVDVMSSSLATGTTIVQSRTFNNLTTTFANYTFNATVSVQPQWVRVSFLNDGGSPNYDLEVDYMTLKGITYQTEAATTYGIGIWKGTGCNVGIFDQSSYLQCNGYFHYLATTSVAALKANPSNGSTQGLRVYPNPVRDVLYVDIASSEDKNIQLRILDIVGREVWQQNQALTKGQTSLEVPLNLDNGVYFMTTTQDKAIRTVKFIVQKD